MANERHWPLAARLEEIVGGSSCHVRLTCGHTHATRHKHGLYVNVRVCDTGSGIPESELTKIFEPHYRATNARRGSSVNSGLGLAITKKLLAVQKVDIEVVSKAGAGTYFSFSLPGAGPSVDASEEATEVAVLAQAG